MADDRLLALERAAGAGDQDAQKALRRHRARTGLCMTCGSRHVLPHFRSCFYCVWQADVVIPEVLVASPAGRPARVHLHGKYLHRTACSRAIHGTGHPGLYYVGDWPKWGLPGRLCQVTCAQCKKAVMNPERLSEFKRRWDQVAPDAFGLDLAQILGSS